MSFGDNGVTWHGTSDWNELQDIECNGFIFIYFGFDNSHSDHKFGSRCGLIADDLSNWSNFKDNREGGCIYN